MPHTDKPLQRPPHLARTGPLDLDRAVLAAYGWTEAWAEALQPNRDDKGKVNPILGVKDPAAEQLMLAQLLDLNATAVRGDRP